MLYHLLYPLKKFFFGFNVFRYITFRSAYAVVTALILTWVFTPLIIRLAYKKNIGESIRSDGPKGHKKKKGTPTMGGLIVLLSLVATILLWTRLDSPHVLIVLFSLVAFGLLGFADDYLKLRKQKGMAIRIKFLGQFLIATAISLYLYFNPELNRHIFSLYLPFVEHPVVMNMGWFFIPLSIIVIVGSSNAVNFTDGLDGLAIGLVLFAALAFMVIIYAQSNFRMAEYLKIPFIKGTAELTVITASITGACLGFLWYNAHPAEIFMGDTGALSLGGALGVLAVMMRQEMVWVIIGGVFVAEVMSVILQVLSFKIRKKRIFLMAPLHHHFELKGWDESKVVIRFWIIGAVLALIGVSTLKLR